MPKTTGPSALETQLKQIVADHLHVSVHPHSPSGPHVRAVMYYADDILGQAFWEPKQERWVVKAFHVPTGPASLVVRHPPNINSLAAAITTVVATLQRRY